MHQNVRSAPPFSFLFQVLVHPWSMVPHHFKGAYIFIPSTYLRPK